MSNDSPRLHNDATVQLVWRSAWAVAGIASISAAMALYTNYLFGAAALLVMSLAILGVGYRAKRRNRVTFEHQLLALFIWLITTVLAIRAGGLAAPAVYGLIVLPGLMSLTGGRLTMRVWIVVVACTLVGLSVAAPYLPPTLHTLRSLSAMRIAAPISAMIFTAVTVSTFERRVARRELALHNARQDAEAARAAAEAARAEADQARVDAESAQARAELANRAKSAFLATMSHEIRTPLTAVVGLAEVLQSASLDANQAHQLGILRGAGRTLLGLVDDVLDLSRIESGQLDIESQPVNVHALLREVVDTFQARHASDTLRIEFQFEGREWISSDALRLRQIALNLVGNAIKFTAEGSVCLRAQVLAGEPHAGTLIVEVRDTGIGIPAHRQKQILLPFTQADQSTARRFGGSGLGLSIVVRLVEHMGGSFQLQSEEGKGTTITLQIPVPYASPAREADTGDSLPIDGRVLLAEDNIVNQQVVRAMLEHLGCTVEIAADGNEAISAIQDHGHQFRLVFMDCQMPHTDGFSATRAIRAAGWSLPVIALTANASPADRQACLDSGMTDYTTKPVTLDELRTMLVRHSTA